MASSVPANVLVVDDEPDLRELICDALSAEGLGVRHAGTGAEACALAVQRRPDVLVVDLRLPDASGLDVIDRVRGITRADLPAVVITGHGDLHLAGEAARRGCCDFLTKPIDLSRLRRAIGRELERRALPRRLAARGERALELARRLNADRHVLRHRLETTGAALTTAYRTLNQQFLRQEAVLRFQRELIGCRSDDDVFRRLFRFFGNRGGSLFGLALSCDEGARLHLMGRFGMPEPDPLTVCEQLMRSLVPVVLQTPVVMRLEAEKHLGLFPEPLARRLVGVTFLAVPFLPAEGKLIGIALLYRKGEQPFTNEELALAELLSHSVAECLQANSAEGREAA